MKSFYQFAFIVFLVLLLGCRQPPPQTLTTVENNAITKEIKGQFNQFVSAINKMNVEEWSNFYSKENFVSAIVGTDYYSSRNTFIDSIKYYFSMRQSQNIKPQFIRVEALAPNLALMTSEEKPEILLKNGQNNISKHVFTMIWKKENEGWKILHSHESWIEIKNP
ncbi:MAG: nuclear transport factor 2 family protein [bacterium]